MESPAVVAHIASANPYAACPVCGAFPVEDDSPTCPSGFCPLYALNPASPVARARAVAWLAR